MSPLWAVDSVQHHPQVAGQAGPRQAWWGRLVLAIVEPPVAVAERSVAQPEEQPSATFSVGKRRVPKAVLLAPRPAPLTRARQSYPEIKRREIDWRCGTS